VTLRVGLTAMPFTARLDLVRPMDLVTEIKAEPAGR